MTPYIAKTSRTRKTLEWPTLTIRPSLLATITEGTASIGVLGACRAEPLHAKW